MKPRQTTTERGYGHKHRLKVTAARAAYVPGQPCARCGKPIQPWQPMDLGHVDGSSKRQYSGLEHRHCNRSAGARRGNRQRGLRRHGMVTVSAWTPSRNW